MSAPKLRLVNEENTSARAEAARSSGSIPKASEASPGGRKSQAPASQKRAARGASKSNTLAKKRAAQARDVMRAPVVCCRAEDSLNTAAQLMWEHDLGAIVVIDEQQRPVSVITDRDVCMAAYTQGIALWGSNVRSAMARRVVSCDAETPISELREHMMEYQLRRIPVTDDQGRLVGIVGLTDLLHESQAELPRTRKRGSSGAELLKLYARIHAAPARPRT